MRISYRVCLSALVMLLCHTFVCAQEKKIEITKAHIPEDAFGHISVRVQQIMQHPMLQLVPWEIIAAGSMDSVGVDPTAIDRIDVIFGNADTPQAKWCAVVSLTEDWKSVETRKIDWEKLRQVNPQAQAQVAQIGPKQVVVGIREYIEKVAKAPAREGELAKQVARIANGGVATAIFVPTPVRELIDKDLVNAPPQSQKTIKTLLDNMQMLALRVDLEPKPSVPVLVETASPDAAQKFAAAWQELLTQIFLESDLGTKGLGPINTPVKAAAVQYEKRFQKELISQLTPTITANRLLIRLDSKILQTIQASSFMPAINAAIVAGERMR